MIVFDDFFSRGSPGNADWEGRKADSIGIEPVHLEWTIVDGGWFPPSHGDYSAVIETRLLRAKARRVLRAKRPLRRMRLGLSWRPWRDAPVIFPLF